MVADLAQRLASRPGKGRGVGLLEEPSTDFPGPTRIWRRWDVPRVSGVGVGVLPESAASRHAQAMDIAIVPLADAWSVREMQICVRSLEALPSFARELVDLLVADAQGRLKLD